MADYFVDKSQVGGNGLTANSAFASITSVPWAAAGGDRAWVRQSHQETITRSTWVGPTHDQDSYSRVSHVIGWPTSLDPFYDERPTAARAAWDADLPATFVYSVYGLRMPLLVFSSNAGIIGGRQSVLANIAFSNSGGASTAGPTFVNDRENLWGDNIAWFYQGGPLLRWAAGPSTLNRIGKITLVVSDAVGNSAGAVPNILSIEHLVIHSASIYGGGFLSVQGPGQIGLVENQSNSVDVMFRGVSAGWSDFNNFGLYIRRICGIEPYSGDITQGAFAKGFLGSVVDDYYSRGPRIVGGAAGAARLVSSAEALHDSKRVFRWDVASIQATQQFYGRGPNRVLLEKKQFAVVSGTPITIRVPIYVGSTNVMSLANGTIKAMLDVRGKNSDYAVQSNILAGSAGMWSGTAPVGGTPYYFDATFLPAETKDDAMFNLRLGTITQATSGAGLIGYTLFGEPY